MQFASLITQAVGRMFLLGPICCSVLFPLSNAKCVRLKWPLTSVKVSNALRSRGTPVFSLVFLSMVACDISRSSGWWGTAFEIFSHKGWFTSVSHQWRATLIFKAQCKFHLLSEAFVEITCQTKSYPMN